MKSPRVYPSAPPEELYAHPPPPYSWAPPPHYSVTHVPPPQGTNLTQEEAEVYEEIRPGERTTSGGRFRLKKGKIYKKHNPQLNTKRGCTDVLCCFLFLVFAVGWAVVAVIGVMWGNPERLINPTDSEGRRCGTARGAMYDLTDRPYLLYMDITKCISYSTVLGGCQTPQICVAQCPNETYAYLELQMLSQSDLMARVSRNVYCVTDADKAEITSYSKLVEKVNQKRCTGYTLASAAVLGRCLPEIIVGVSENLQAIDSSLDRLTNGLNDANVPHDYVVNGTKDYVNNVLTAQDSVISKIAHDLSKSWWQILSMIAIAGILAFVWTVVMRILGGVMIWTSILAAILALGGGCGYSWWRYYMLKKAEAIDDFSFQPALYLYFEMPTTWMVIGISGSIIFIILFLIVIFVRKRISIAVALIEESSKAIGNMMSTLIFPIFPFALHILVFIIWGSITIWLASSGKEVCKMVGPGGIVTNQSQSCNCEESVTNPSCSYIGLEKQQDFIFWLQLYNLFAFFWVSCFVTALGDISLAGAFASHYWALDKSKDLPSFPVLRALGRAIRYNMGSLAFGSLIIAIVKIIRVILEYLDNKLNTTQNKVLKIILGCLKCCFWCMEVFFKFLTKNAYIMMAIYGRSFFTSAKDSFLLLTRNIVRTVVVGQVAGILLFLGKAMITVGMGVIAFFWFSGRWVVQGIAQVDYYYYFVPIIIVIIGSYFMADLFFDVYEMAVDTTFICFLEDSEQNDGTPEKPFYMSKNLQEILGKFNKPEKKY